MFIITFCFLFSCVAPEKTVETSKQSEKSREQEKPEKIRFDESFDPLTLNDDTWVVEKKSHLHKNQILTSVETNGRYAAQKKELKEQKEQMVFGFRVQLYSTTDYYKALGVRDEAGAKLLDDIYVDYEQPYYKVRAGNFTMRENAEEIKNIAKSLGYADAWVIQTNVLLREK
ncbi:SPOR domain-containing protein [bacterium]|nr:SPOR domain-containing protein [bacterium]